MTILVDAIATALAHAGLLVERRGVLPREVSTVVDDSRAVHPGAMFIAVRGTVVNGQRFLAAAAERGARVVITEDARDTQLPALVVRDSRRAAAVAASAAYGWPACQLQVVGVTGTNGKTTTVSMLRYLLDSAEGASASIGTLGVHLGSEGRPLAGGDGLTTPGPVELQRVFRELVDAGVTRVAMEVSSHALDQHRAEGVDFDVAVFTNFTRDHLDYHKTMEAYFAAKATLLDALAPTGTLVVNLDDSAWRGLVSPRRRVDYSERITTADVHADRIEYDGAGSRWTLALGAEQYEVRLPLLGDFNVINALASSAAAWALGIRGPRIAERLATMPQTPGRLELLNEQPRVLRDYAHTPDALVRALRAVQPFTPGRLILVFGCGGDRDAGKRPVMGAIAEATADLVIVTSDNPRFEDPEKILDEIEAGMGTRRHERIEDRRQAIRRALQLADAGDVVVLAGKGHETYQMRGTEKLPFDEKVIVAQLIRELFPRGWPAGRGAPGRGS